jgi:two-component sensor histidine kinase
MDSYAEATGAIGLRIRDLGTRSSVAAPIIVEGRLWGLMSVGTREEPLPRDAEARLTSFTELVATAIANAASRSELAASRARIVAAADEARRRIQRDLHDGSQQQVVSLMLELRAAAAAEPPDVGELRAQLARTAQGLAAVLEELREISQGIYPAPLSRGGLGPALKVLARRSPVPVELDLRAERRLPEHVEVAAYYAVAEALANAAKHAQASLVNVVLQPDDATLKLAIHESPAPPAAAPHCSSSFPSKVKARQCRPSPRRRSGRVAARREVDVRTPNGKVHSPVPALLRLQPPIARAHHYTCPSEPVVDTGRLHSEALGDPLE